MFNFFDEIKKSSKGVKEKLFDEFNLINVGGRLLYIEGHKGLVTLSKELVSFKVSGGVVIVEGKDMMLDELSENTIKIVGKIKKVEQI